ncbi:Vta1 like-domain-containing protein [Scheffersomyces xylosifermentans]|uniref:Vta1 like-domain-containing protein n=1 Tax=Scheffersomyces xylosifermentans TaxID=1304137 RepID=UPI00315E02A8
MASSITLDSIPESLKADKSVTPYIARSVELHSVNPIVSYYCKIYVLEYILVNKLHTTSKDIEVFTIQLLDDTESIKKSTEDESLHKALNEKSLAISVVLSFSYKLFNSCLESLSNYSRTTNKAALVGKFRATLNFLSLLSIFTNNEDPSVDWSKLTGGKASDSKQFETLNKEKIKILKFQLSKLIKDEIPFKGEEINEQDLEDELNKELEALGDSLKLPGVPTVLADISSPEEKDSNFKLPGAPNFLPDDAEDAKDLNGHTAEDLPQTPSFLDDEEPTDDADVSLPGVPHFAPDDSDTNSDVKLPGAPKYLPDDDITHINKSSSIQVFPPGLEKRRTSSVSTSRKASVTTAAQHPHHHITKENIAAIVDTSEQISKVQKHAKFAISALNYDDIDTAEKELLQGLELLRILKAQGGSNID